MPDVDAGSLTRWIFHGIADLSLVQKALQLADAVVAGVSLGAVLSVNGLSVENSEDGNLKDRVSRQARGEAPGKAAGTKEETPKMGEGAAGAAVAGCLASGKKLTERV